jgi:hypothetical protein
MNGTLRQPFDQPPEPLYEAFTMGDAKETGQRYSYEATAKERDQTPAFSHARQRQAGESQRSKTGSNGKAEGLVRACVARRARLGRPFKQRPFGHDPYLSCTEWPAQH